MPVPTETLWNTRKVSIVFAISSIAMLASIVWMVKVDYARPWRQIQNRRNAWRWTRGEFEGTTTEGSARYTATSFGVERWAAWITEPEDWAVVEPMDGAFLTLTTCHPKGSASKRLIVQARMVGTGTASA